VTDTPTPPVPPVTPAPKQIEPPMAVWVQGGTTSTRHDMQQRQAFAEAEARRDAEVERHRAAAQNPFEARIATTSLGSQQRDPMVVLGFKNQKDHFIHNWMICELITELGADATEPELMLQMCCPYCIKRGVPAGGDAQFKIRQSNRAFSLDTRGADQRARPALGQPIARDFWCKPDEPDNPEFHVEVAGTITTHGWIKHGWVGCSWDFRIDDSVIITRSK